MNDNIFKNDGVAVYLTFVFLPFDYISGAYVSCYRSNAKIKCRGTFQNKPVTLEIEVKSFKAPVEINITLDILNVYSVTHNKEFNGEQDIPLPKLSASRAKDIFLTVNASPQDNGDLQLEVQS